MKFRVYVLSILVLVACRDASVSATAGGQILGITNSPDSRTWLSFQTTYGNSYQVQACPVVGTRYWANTLPVIRATGSLATVSNAMQTQAQFYRVLEFTDPVFWYDWGYYYQAPFLSIWGLGTVENDYVHLDRAYEWYIDQADTGTYAGNNCGPSSVTMAIKWVDQTFGKTAEDARKTFLRNGGWWYTSDIINYLNLQAIPNTTSVFTGPDQIAGILSQGNLIILCMSTEFLTRDDSDEHRVGRFYGYASGHFLVVKAWRATDSALLFEVYDPNNWHAVYADGTPKGRNRHLDANELANSIANWWNYLIVVHPRGGGGGTARLSNWLRPIDPAQIVHAWGR